MTEEKDRGGVAGERETAERCTNPSLASALFRKVAQELGDALDPYAAKGAKG
jgi:hypothetical protein